MEQDRLVWVPSTSREFWVKSAYQEHVRSRSPAHCKHLLDTWKQMSKPDFRGRHNILLWKLVANILPILDRLARFVPVLNTCCYLCGEPDETSHHWLLKCPVSRFLWWNSPWKIRLEAYEHMDVQQWISMMLDKNNMLPVDQTEKLKMSVFLVVAFEQVWMPRNKMWKEAQAPDWIGSSNMLNTISMRYWTTTVAKSEGRNRGIL